MFHQLSNIDPTLYEYTYSDPFIDRESRLIKREHYMALLRAACGGAFVGLVVGLVLVVLQVI